MRRLLDVQGERPRRSPGIQGGARGLSGWGSNSGSRECVGSAYNQGVNELTQRENHQSRTWAEGCPRALLHLDVGAEGRSTKDWRAAARERRWLEEAAEQRKVTQEGMRTRLRSLVREEDERERLFALDTMGSRTRTRSVLVRSSWSWLQNKAGGQPLVRGEGVMQHLRAGEQDTDLSLSRTRTAPRDRGRVSADLTSLGALPHFRQLCNREINPAQS